MPEPDKPPSLLDLSIDAVSTIYVKRLNRDSTLIDPERDVKIWKHFPPLYNQLGDYMFDGLKRKTEGCRPPVKASILMPFIFPHCSRLTTIDISGITVTDNLLAKLLVNHQATLRSLTAWDIENPILDMYNICKYLKGRNVKFNQLEYLSVNQTKLLVPPTFKRAPLAPSKQFNFACFSSTRPSTSVISSDAMDEFSRAITDEIVDPGPHYSQFPGPKPPTSHFLTFAPNLRTLVIHRSTDEEAIFPERIDNPEELFDSITMHVKKLRVLTLVNWPRINSRFLLTLMDTLTHLSLRDTAGVENCVDHIGHCKNIVYLDVSCDVRYFREYPHPNKTLYSMVKDLAMLKYLDISCTNLNLHLGNRDYQLFPQIGSEHDRQVTSDIMALRALHQELDYLGVYGCKNIIAYRDLPAKKVFSHISEDRLLATMEVYSDRQPMLFHAMNEVYNLYRYSDDCTRHMDLLESLLSNMRKYHDNQDILAAGSAAIFYIARREDMTEPNRIRVAKFFLSIIKTMYKHPLVIRNVCLTLCHFESLPETDSDFYLGLIEKLIVTITQSADRFTHQLVIFVMNTMASYLTKAGRNRVGTIGGVDSMCKIIKRCCKEIQNDRVLEASWTFLWVITEDSRSNCNIFMSLGGNMLISDVYDMFPNEYDMIKSMIGALGNITEHAVYRDSLAEQFASKLHFLFSISNNDLDVKFNVAAVLANFLSCGITGWDAEANHVSYQKVYNRLITAIKQWPQYPIGEGPTNHLRPGGLVRLMNSDSYASQLFGAFGIFHLLSVDISRHAPEFLKENGLVIYTIIRHSYRRDAHIHVLLNRIQYKMSIYFVKEEIEEPDWNYMDNPVDEDHLFVPIENLVEEADNRMEHDGF